MFKTMALVIGFAGMQCFQAVSTDVPSGKPPLEGDGGQAGDSVSAPALRIVRVIEVTDGSTYYKMPIWSPDGKRLAFTNQGSRGIYVRNADGPGLIKEVFSPDSPGTLCWTSDSKALVRRTRGHRTTYVDVETGEETLLVKQGTPPGQPCPYGETGILDLETGALRCSGEYYFKGQTPLPDITLKMDFKNDRLRFEDGDRRCSFEFPHRVILVSLSPARDKVAFAMRDGNIYVSNLDGSSMTPIGYGSGKVWSPDGRRLVYLGAIEDSHFDMIAAELFVVNADGTCRVQLTDTPDLVEMYPVWSPDGMRIAYSTSRTGKIFVAVLEEVD